MQYQLNKYFAIAFPSPFEVSDPRLQIQIVLYYFSLLRHDCQLVLLIITQDV